MPMFEISISISNTFFYFTYSSTLTDHMVPGNRIGTSMTFLSLLALVLV